MATARAEMPPRDRSDDSDDSEADEDVSIADSEGWQDAEPDQVEDIQIKDFFSDETFTNVQSMLDNCKTQYSLDVRAIINTLKLDFEGAIKLVNYIRSEAQQGRKPSQITTRDVFDDATYLKPVLEDDALLFSLDELLDASQLEDSPEKKLAFLQECFQEYKIEVAESAERWLNAGETTASSSEALAQEATKTTTEKQDNGYFGTYADNYIHEVMLQDTVRTDAYRDFIYGNKHLFAGKTVLDIGCGTGILSMFCAKAGAARVIAVDNSDIVEKARRNITVNKLDDIITVVRGKIEEVALPHGIDKVDIIVSEWMGYCLLHEAMLDSVLHARDRLLKAHGLMVPSHCTMHIGAFEDPNYIADTYTFWNDVYGFDMTPMVDHAISQYDQIQIVHRGAEHLVAQTIDRQPFQILDLHTITSAELDFVRHFEMNLTKDADEVDGFCIWFDAIFLPGRTASILPKMLNGADVTTQIGDGQAILLPTGPRNKPTHWSYGLCTIDRASKQQCALREGQRLQGRITIKKDKEDRRGLDIAIKWSSQDEPQVDGRQQWFLT